MISEFRIKSGRSPAHTKIKHSHRRARLHSHNLKKQQKNVHKKTKKAQYARRNCAAKNFGIGDVVGSEALETRTLGIKQKSGRTDMEQKQKMNK